MAEAIHKIVQLNRLPAIPVIASEIIQLVSDPNSTAKELAELIERDPSISAQIMRYARSAFFGYKGNIDSIQDAITRVLGFDIVSNIAFGIASSKAFNVPVAGPLGLASLWHQSLLSATLAQNMIRSQRLKDISPGMAYLVALLQHFGLFALGHVQTEEYKQLSQSVTDYNSFEEALDEQRWDYSPTEVGAALLMHWNMPVEVVESVRYLMAGQVPESNQKMVALVRLVNGLLSEQGVGLPGYQWPITEAASVLRLDLDECREIAAEAVSQSADIDLLVERLISMA
jgi:HD-like signal output (HDOD) protein